MKTWQRRVVIGLGIAVAILVPAYWWLFMESHLPGGSFPLDLAEVRRLAGSIPGDKPGELRVERLTTMDVPHVGAVAGAGWDKIGMAVFAYQLVYPDHTALVDVGMDQATATSWMGVKTFDDAAFQRLRTAMEHASLIVVTHEHADHLGALATDPKLAQVLPAVKLTTDQLAHLDHLKPVVFPDGALSGVKGLENQGLLAVAPGVVLIKAPGHTPGSQLVYVQRADGAEYLFIGDVAWQQDNLTEVRERARFVTLMMKEDRDAVLRELDALHRLSAQEPKLHVVPGHDASVIARLEAGGFLTQEFKGIPLAAQ